MFTLAKALVCLLSLAGHASSALSLLWPNYPEATKSFSLRWSNGVPPYNVYVLSADLQYQYYKYTGSDLITYWTFKVEPGVVVKFQVIDSTKENVTSPAITVLAPPSIAYPTDPVSGVPQTIKWSGGWSPYSVDALAQDLQHSYWNYSGSDTSATWDCNVDAGTQLVFRVVDNQNINDTGFLVGVLPNPSVVSQSQLSVLSTASVASVASLSSLTQTLTGTPTNTPASTKGSQSSGTTTFTSTPTPNSNVNKKSNNTGAIVGSVVGGVVALSLIAAIAYLIYKKYSRPREYVTAENSREAMIAAEKANTDTFHTPVESSYLPSSQGHPPAAGWRGVAEVQ